MTNATTVFRWLRDAYPALVFAAALAAWCSTRWAGATAEGPPDPGHGEEGATSVQFPS